ncbi:uncharacterized protein LOC129620925 isoform X2 [Bubalus kerabau]|uniref:uncharacterized protein LOC129620925 isoform X2 n=1 Tax=Bubalus carabanensis TaxID=3119969 RepID=UPI00244E8FDE|nr:uncharacterized protein LOC129620925 isoform X2 [Bubalus carabanensis]
MQATTTQSTVGPSHPQAPQSALNTHCGKCSEKPVGDREYFLLPGPLPAGSKVATFNQTLKLPLSRAPLGSGCLTPNCISQLSLHLAWPYGWFLPVESERKSWAPSWPQLLRRRPTTERHWGDLRSDGSPGKGCFQKKLALELETEWRICLTNSLGHPSPPALGHRCSWFSGFRVWTGTSLLDFLGL